MAFQPFGFHFEVRSDLSPDAVKAAIRARKEGMFDPKDSARGFVAGPFLYLWWGMSRSAPMLLGRISSDGFGARISGRAGYATIIPILIFVPLTALLFFQMAETGNITLKNAGLLALMGALVAFAFWADPHDADPLVRFLRNAVEKPGRAPKVKPVVLPPADSFLKTLTLEESGSEMDGPVTPAMVKESLQAIDGDGFVILSSAEQRYVQTVQNGDGFIVEKRDGDDDHHYQAARRGSTDSKDIFTFDETLAIFLAYGAGAPMPAFMEWKKTRV